MDRYLEFTLKTVEPTLAFDLQERYNKLLLSFTSEDKELSVKLLCEDTLKNINNFGRLKIDNLDVWRKLNSMIDFFNSTNQGVKELRNIDPIPTEIERFSEAWKIISSVDRIIFEYHDTNLEHIKTCSAHQFYWQTAWQAFIVSLFGCDFGVVYNSFIESLEEVMAQIINSCSPPFSLN